MSDRHIPSQGEPVPEREMPPQAAESGIRNEEQGTPPQAANTDEINLLEYLLILVKHKKLILGTSLATFILACGVTLLMPNIYTSTARILPPPQEKSGGLGAMLGGIGDLAVLAGVSVGSATGDLYVGMLQSRTVSDAIIDRFDLMSVYEQEYRGEMYKKIGELVSISLGKKDGIISVSVDDEVPERAAAIANAYVEELKKLNVRLNLSNAGRERIFLEERLAVIQNELLRAEEALKEFQEKNKAIRIDAQATAIIDAIAKLKGELANKEVELGVLLSYQTEQSAQVKAVRESITQMKEQLRRLEQPSAGRTAAEDIFLPTSEVPELGIQYGRLLRQYKVQETLFELLTKQYEMAKITEAKNTSPLQVLDAAATPDRKSKPRRIFIVIIATFAVVFLAIIAAFLRESGEYLDPKDLLLWKAIRQNLQLWNNKAG